MDRFEEKQYLRKTWIAWLVMIPLAACVITVIAQAASEGRKAEFWIPVILVPLVFIPLFLAWLEVRVDAAGVYYRWYPLQWRLRSLRWEEINRAEIRKYKPLPEYGGWGIKGTRKNRAVNMTGNTGLQLELQNGRKLLIGIGDAAALRDTLEHLRQKGIPALNKE